MARSVCFFCTNFHFLQLTPAGEALTEVWFSFLSPQGRSWIVKRSYEDFRVLDKHLHLCIYDRRFSQLSELPRSDALKDSPEVNYQLWKHFEHSHQQGVRRDVLKHIQSNFNVAWVSFGNWLAVRRPVGVFCPKFQSSKGKCPASSYEWMCCSMWKGYGECQERSCPLGALDENFVTSLETFSTMWMFPDFMSAT